MCDTGIFSPEREIVDHSESARGKHASSQCVHRECINHEPVWEDVGKRRLEPNPGFFGLKKTYWIKRHCGKAMARYKEEQTRRCRKCGGIEDCITEEYRKNEFGSDALYRNKDIALCLCCGYIYKASRYGGGGHNDPGGM